MDASRALQARLSREVDALQGWVREDDVYTPALFVGFVAYIEQRDAPIFVCDITGEFGRRDSEMVVLADGRTVLDTVVPTERCSDCGETFNTEEDRWHGWSEDFRERLCCECLEAREERMERCSCCGESFDIEEDRWFGWSEVFQARLCLECLDAREEGEEEEEGVEADPNVRPYSADVFRSCRGFRGAKGEKLHDRLPYLGVELEVISPSRSERADLNTCIRHVAIMKADSSLSPGGVEVVTIPATLRWHRTHWRKTFQILGGWEVDSSCGMHVHMSRGSVGPLTLGKMLCFLNAEENCAALEKVAGRTLRDLSGYTKRHDGVTVKTNKDNFNDRYAILNIRPSATIEFRLFRGTIDRETMLRNLEFCVAVRGFCMTTSYHRLTWEDFRAYLIDQGSYPLLSKFLSLPMPTTRGARKARGRKDKVAAACA